MGARNDALEVYPNRPAPVVVLQDGERIVREDMLWGFPPFRKGAGYGTNFRTLTVNLWRDWLDKEHRCVVPATAFAEPDRNTSKPVEWRWFERTDKPTFFSPDLAAIDGRQSKQEVSQRGRLHAVLDHDDVPCSLTRLCRHARR
jgi:putative SOS response-associated peptidase YedK